MVHRKRRTSRVHLSSNRLSDLFFKMLIGPTLAAPQYRMNIRGQRGDPTWQVHPRVPPCGR